MPVHNWKGIDDGVFHDLHCSWIAELKRVLNGGLLPPSYYAMSEQRTGNIGPDMLALEVDEIEGSNSGGTAVMAPPKVAMVKTFDVLAYVNRQNSIIIRHATDDRIVAVLEIVSRGNKWGKANLESFMEKAHGCLDHRIHFTYVDVHPPGQFDPYGIHGALCLENGDDPPAIPSGKTLSAAGYEAADIVSAYVNPFGVGDIIPVTPLYLRSKYYVMLPFEETYIAPFASFPQRLRT